MDFKGLPIGYIKRGRSLRVKKRDKKARSLFNKRVSLKGKEDIRVEGCKTMAYE